MSIRVITEPSVFVVGRQSVDESGIGRFLNQIDASEWTTDAPSAGEKLCEIAGRLCYESFKRPRPGGNARYIEHILEVGHGSVIEHAVFNFIVTGVSRSLTHELVRHRVGFAYSQLSQRYVDESDVAFVVPPALIEEVRSAYPVYDKGGDPSLLRTGLARGLGWLKANHQAHQEYMNLAEYLEFRGESRKQAREAARSVLPNCTETKIFVTANVRALRHFVEMRGDAGADAEIRRLAHAFLAVLREESPNLFSDYAIDRVAGVEVVCTPYMKV